MSESSDDSETFVVVQSGGSTSCSLQQHAVFGVTSCSVHTSLKAGTHRPKRWASETFGETQTRSGTNLFGVFSCVGSFWNHADSVWSDSERVSAVGGLDATGLVVC